MEQLQGIADPNDPCQLSTPSVTATDISILSGSGAITTAGQFQSGTPSAIPSTSVLNTELQQSQMMPYLAIGGAVLLVIFLMAGRR